MPELPEVETIKEDLAALVVGSRIESVEVPAPSLVEEPGVEDFLGRLGGAGITGVRRRAKHLIVELEGGDSLVLQLKIGGQLLLVSPVPEPGTALMLVLGLDGGRKLFLRDETGFTRARLLDGEALGARLAPLGPEPFDKEFTQEYLRGKLGSRRVQIKPALLEQALVSGIGNIYVDEILYDARLHPRRKANTLSDGEWGALHRAIGENLRAGIEHRGTTFDLYRDVLGRKGHHQDHLRVFLRAGRPCPSECGGQVVREKVGGRATFYCPSCQREDGRGAEQTLESWIL